MKRLILALSITLLASQAFGADYRWNVPLPKPAPEKVALRVQEEAYKPVPLAQVTNPDPFNTQQRQSQGSTSNVASVPIVTVPAPIIDTTPGPLSWIWTIIGGAATAIFGANSLRKPGGGIGREEIKNVAEQAALRVLDSGLPGQILQTAANRVPILGGIVEQLRPMIREELRERLGGQEQQAPNIATGPNLEAWKAQLLQEVGNVVQNRIEAALAKRAQS